MMITLESWEYALAHFRCEASPDRLRATSSDEVALALAPAPRGTLRTMSAVYVVGNEANGLHKVGYADHLSQRMSGLNSGSPVALHLRHFVFLVDCLVAQRVEKLAHSILAEYRRRGEWFDVTAERAGDAIAEAVSSQRFKWWTEPERRRLTDYAKSLETKRLERARLFGT